MKKAIALAPDYQKAHSNLGRALKAAGALRGAVASYRKALALAKKNATEVWPDERPWLEQEDLDALVKKADDAGGESQRPDAQRGAEREQGHDPVAFARAVGELAPKAL